MKAHINFCIATLLTIGFFSCANQGLNKSNRLEITPYTTPAYSTYIFGTYKENRIFTDQKKEETRKVVYRNIEKLVKRVAKTLRGEKTKITVNICIDQSGIPTYGEIDMNQTTTKKRKVLIKTLEAVQDYRYEPDLTAPDEECLLLRLTFSISRSSSINCNF